MTLAKELALYACDKDPAEFEDILCSLHVNMHPSWNVEELLYEPDQGKVYCDAVRARAGKGLPNRVILRRLQNVRKKGEAPKAKKKGKKS